ncbi:hypothetical protein BP5796_05227 [Coleophoma crateriformis]|uniref:ASTRA-associated protein 1 n=1 Tax=Coleophoma crateriformis TaxID=565419 RepID=A0A3D8S2L9_9HELO|nr:hypothetical protein BP5796_05227 [Coleophoma crateriformis]
MPRLVSPSSKRLPHRLQTGKPSSPENLDARPDNVLNKATNGWMALPPAQPSYILRGHASQIHCACFIRSNKRLVSGDADGWIVIWSLDIKRPLAVWRAHEGAILGADTWGPDKLITHGKDNKLVVWRLSSEDESSLSTVLPVDTPPEPRRQPWVLHILNVNTMNFCSFACGPAYPAPTAPPDTSDELLIAVPNTLSSETVDIFHLPTGKRIHTVPSAPGLKGGMVMAVSIFHHPQTKNLIVVAGYESGHTAISQFTMRPKSWDSRESTYTARTSAEEQKSWQTSYLSQPHTQPLLSLSTSPDFTYYLTSSADSVIAKHLIPSTIPTQLALTPSQPHKINQTKHAGQQSLRIRNDGKIFATAGWDARVRVYGCKTLKEVAVLKWHQEGCFAVAFADVDVDVGGGDKGDSGAGKLISVKEERVRRAEKAHWIAVGSKDGKISLWEIY